MTDKIQRYSQGVCQDGAAILSDGVRMTVDEIVNTLNIHIETIEAQAKEIEALTNSLDAEKHMNEQLAKEIAGLKKEIKNHAKFGLGFALCHSSFTETRNAIKKAQIEIMELTK